MTLASIERCDAGLSNGKRCQNRAQVWIVGTVNLTGVDESYPMAVCELHRRNGAITRLGPDRRTEYANRHRDIPAALGPCAPGRNAGS